MAGPPKWGLGCTPRSYEGAASHGFFLMYYGPEFVAKKVQQWISDRDIGARYIEPGSPWQNGHNENFNAVFRDGCLNRWLFASVREARETAEAWLHEYNGQRPHGSLSGRSPAEFFELWEQEKRDAA